MKKFIISFMCVLLLSCHPVTATFASVIENETITYPVTTDKELPLCKDIADFAYVAMQARQNVVSEEDQLSLAPVPTTQEEAVLKVLLGGIIHDANIFPVYDDMSDKVEVSERFSEVIYDICKGDK